jgi:phage protein D
VPDDLFYRVQVSAAGADYDLSPDLTSLSIEEDETRPDLLVVNLADPYKVFGHALQEGMDVEVELGTADDHSLVFRGRIHQVDASFPAEGVPTLTFRGHDNGMRLGLRRRNRPWSDTSLSGLVRSIADEHGFPSTNVRLAGDPEFVGNGIRQQDETDLAFLHRLADAYGAETYVSARDTGDEFVFLAQREIMTSDPEVTLYHGRCGVADCLLSFEARANVAEIQLPRVFAGVDYAGGEALDAVEAPVEEVGDHEDAFFDENMTAFREREPDRAAQLQELLGAAPAAREQVVSDLGEVERVTVPAFTTAEELRTRRENQFSTSIHGMRASGSTGGNKDLRAQTNVGLEDVGGRFSGVWFLSQVRHTLDSGGFRTDFECRR